MSAAPDGIFVDPAGSFLSLSQQPRNFTKAYQVFTAQAPLIGYYSVMIGLAKFFLGRYSSQHSTVLLLARTLLIGQTWTSMEGDKYLNAPCVYLNAPCASSTS